MGGLCGRYLQVDSAPHRDCRPTKESPFNRGTVWQKTSDSESWWAGEANRGRLAGYYDSHNAVWRPDRYRVLRLGRHELRAQQPPDQLQRRCECGGVRHQRGPLPEPGSDPEYFGRPVWHLRPQQLDWAEADQFQYLGDEGLPGYRTPGGSVPHGNVQRSEPWSMGFAQCQLGQFECGARGPPSSFGQIQFALK